MARFCAYLIHKTDNTMKTLTDFRVMPFEKKCDVITFNGNYLAHRTLGEWI